MYDIISCIRVPKLFYGTSHVNAIHPDRIAQNGYEQIVRISVFSKDNECFYRWIACAFTLIHVFSFDFEQLSCATKVIKRYENNYLF